MTDVVDEIRTIVIERKFSHPPERIWRALTQRDLIAEWLMANDFEPAAGHRFHLRGDWGAVACEVRQIEPFHTLVYSWDAHGLESVVTWTLAPSDGGTLLRMAQTGFRRDQESFYQGAQAGWTRFFTALDDVLGRMV